MSEAGGKRPVIRGMYHLFIGYSAALTVTAISSIIVARLLGPQLYGLYGLALVTPGYIYSAIHFNTSSSTVRFSAKYSSEGAREKAISFGYSTVIFQFLVAFVAFLISLPLTGIIATDLLKRPELQSYIPVASASILGLALMNVSSGHFQGLGEMRKSATISIVRALTRLVVGVGLILVGFSVMGAVVGYTAGYIAGGLSGLAFVMYTYKKVIPSDFFRTIVASLGYSLPLYATAALSMFVIPYESTLLANFVSNQQIGGYFAASNALEVISFVAAPITTALFPLFSRFNKDSNELYGVYSSSVKYSTLFLVPVIFAVMTLATPMISIIYGTSYRFAGLYMIALAAPNLLVGLGTFSQSVLLSGIGETKKSMLAGMTGVLVYVGCDTLFIHFLNVYGISLSFLLSGLASIFVGNMLIKPIVGRGILVPSVARIYLASAVSAGLIFPLSFLRMNADVTLAVGILLFLAVLVPLLAVLKALTREDLFMLETYFKNIGLLSFPMMMLLRYYHLFDKIHQSQA